MQVDTPLTPNKKKVAIVVPLSNRAELYPDEEISLRHLTHYLGKYDKYLIVPEELEIHIPDFDLARFDAQYFGSAAANTRLMLSPLFYERFQNYEYILIYHLDALVFSDQLEYWCDAGYDYIGPPWFPADDMPWVSEPGVGNGGFCLRKIESCLKVLNSSNYRLDPDVYWQRIKKKPLWQQIVRYPQKYKKKVHYFNNIRREIDEFDNNEDLFWWNRAAHYYPEFKFAPIDVAMRFAFEGEPRQCFEQIGNQLPFGCHAWPRYDREFWEPFLLHETEIGQ